MNWVKLQFDSSVNCLAHHPSCKLMASCKKIPSGLNRCHAKRRMGMLGCDHHSFGMTQAFFFFLFGILILGGNLFSLQKFMSLRTFLHDAVVNIKISSRESRFITFLLQKY